MPISGLTESEQRMLDAAINEAFREQSSTQEDTNSSGTGLIEQIESISEEEVNSLQIEDVFNEGTNEEQGEEETVDEREEDERKIDSEAEISGSVNTARFSGAPWFNMASKISVTVGGCGGIGSYLTFFLSRTGVEHITVYDPDVVDATNMAGQLFSMSRIGNKKVDAMSDFNKLYSSYYRMWCIDKKFDNTTEGAEVMLSGFDNMKARKDYFNAWMKIVNNTPKENRKKLLYIDGRLSAERFQIFCLRGNYTWAINDYETNWLFDDSEAESDICSYKQTTFCAAMIASLMVNLFVNWISNLEGGVRSVPYFTEYNAEFVCLERR